MKRMREMAPYHEPPRGPMRGAAAEPSPMRRMPAVNPEQTFFHFDFLRALEMHRGLALGIFLSALVLSGAYLVRRWNTYKAESLVYVQPAPPHLLGNNQGQQNWPFDANTYESYIQQQIHNVTREDVLAGAARRIPNFRGSNESEQAAADRLNGDIQVDRVSTGYQIAITATAGSAGEAAQMANAVANSFIASATKELRSGDQQRIALLGEERDRVMKELASDRGEQDALNKQLGVAAVGTATPDPYDDQIAAVRAELVKARADNDEAAAKLTATAGGGSSSAALDAAADQIVAADPGLVSMKTALNKRRSDLISQMANLTPQHPLFKQDTEELAKINSSLDAMTKELRAKAAVQIEQNLKSELERTSGVEARLNAQLAQMTRAAGSATPRLQRANDLATDISRLQARYAMVDEEYRNLTIDNAAPGAVYLSAPAIAPLHADRKKVYRNVFVLLLAGIIFALAAALIAHNLDPRIYIAADVEQVLGFAPMALLPDLYEVGTGVAEEYMLRLAAAVEHAHQQGHLNSCIFTAVAPGAGASTVSKRVSSMLQAMGRSTALVDAVGAPTEEIADPGNELMHMPRGSRSTALLQQMEGANDDTIVVTDTAPLLISGETEYLARFVDSAIVVIESGTTTKTQLREVAQTLERLDVSAVGFVLNRISLEKGNAAFRHSVRAVEKHLKAQSRAYDRQRQRSQPSARETAVETPGPLAVRERRGEAVSEPPAETMPAEARTFEPPAQEREFVQERETMFVNQPHDAATDTGVARETKTDAPATRPPGWLTENSMSPDDERFALAASARHGIYPFQAKAEAEDGFLPWENQAPAPVRTRFAASPPQAFSETFAADTSEVSIPPLSLDDLSAPGEATPRPADEPSSYLAAPPEPASEPVYAPFLKESLEPVESVSGEPHPGFENTDRGQSDYLRRFADELETSAVPSKPASSPEVEAATAHEAPRDEFEALLARSNMQSEPQQETAAWRGLASFEPSRAGGNPLQSSMAVPTKSARGREGAHIVLGGRPSAPLTGEEVPNAWRERLRSEAEMIPPDQPLEPAAGAPFEASETTGEQLSTDRMAPFAWTEEGHTRQEPLKEWWEGLESSVAQRPATEAVLLDPVPGSSAVQEAAAREAASAPVAGEPAPQVKEAQDTAEISEQDEALYHAASRLSGLRNLLVSLGIQTLHQGAEQRKAEAIAGAYPTRALERAVYGQPADPDTKEDQPARTVNARPEIIPPRFNVEAAEREKAAKTTKTPLKSPRVSSWDTPDDVDVLPSRRGQYRRPH